MSQRIKTTELAGIQYVGLDGITSSCIKAITRLLSSDELIKSASLITCNEHHAFILNTDFDEPIAVKAGFASGYSGEGSRGLATALVLLYRHNIEIEEYIVDSSFMERLASSCLLTKDIELIENGKPRRPSRWSDYVYDQKLELGEKGGHLTRHYPLAVPFAIIDDRIMDLAVSFPQNQDTAIISAYRRLEDLIRKRTGLSGEGSKLFSKAFMQEDSPLRWDVPDESEVKGRASLFSAIYMAFRNARVHREIPPSSDAELREFLLVNELYRLEAEAMTEMELLKKKKDDKALEECISSIKQISF